MTTILILVLLAIAVFWLCERIIQTWEEPDE